MKLKKRLYPLNVKLSETDSSKEGYYDLQEEKTKIRNDIDKLESELNVIWDCN